MSSSALITKDSGIAKIDDPKEKDKAISEFFEDVKTSVNGGLTFANNFNGKISNITFSASATDTALAHGLSRTPAGYVVLKKSANMTVYDGAAAWTSTNLYLRSSAAGTATILVF